MTKYTQWVACWGNATSITDRKEAVWAKDLTLRYPVKVCFSGAALRMRFSNLTGTEPVTLTCVYVAKAKANPYQALSVCFGGQESVTIAPGKEVESDALSLDIVAGEMIEVSIYLGDFTQMNAGTLITGPLSKGKYCYGSYADQQELPLDLTRNTNWFYFLNTIDVLTEEQNHALVCYGDSITAQSWPDYLAMQLWDQGIRHLSVVRRAVSGTRILRQYDCITYQAYGLKGATRFPIELNVAGACAVIVQHGINDIIHPVGREVNVFRPWSDMPTVEALTEGIENLYVAHARQKGLKVFSGTLLPIEGWRTYNEQRDEMRGQLNEWLRQSPVFDGCIDFDQAVRDPNHPAAFGPGYDSGDHLHPSEKAYERMAQEAVSFMKRNLILLLITLMLLPATLLAKKKNKAEVVVPQPVLTLDEQQHFDSLYFLAITQEQCHRPDSAIALMQSAVSYYDSALMSKGYETGMRLNAPVDEEDNRPLGKQVSSQEAPGLAAALYFLSNQYRQQNNAVGSVINISRATSIDTVNFWYNSAHADLMMALSRTDDAREIYERLARQYPDKSEPLYALSDLYLRIDSTDQCLRILNQLEEIEGVSSPLTEYKFFILQKAGRAEEGFEEYRKLIGRYPYNVQYRLKLGDLQMQNAQISEAKKTYDEAAAIEPDNAYVWVAQANYFSMTGDQARADSLVAGALVNPNLDVDTKNTVMTEYLKGTYRKFATYRERLKAGQTDVVPLDTLALLHKVDELFSTVTAQHPSAPEFYELQAEWFSAQRKDSVAAECIRFAVDLKPTNPEYWEKYLYYSTSWLPKDQMISRCDEALAQHPEMQSAYLIKAWAYVQQEQNDKAIEQYLLAIDHLTPPDASQVSTLWGNIGDLYHLDHLDDKAYECYEKSLKYNPNNFSVLNNYAYYLSQAKKDLSRAEAMALKVIQKYPDNATYLDTYAWILYLEESYVLADFYQQKALDNVSPEDTDVCTLYDHFGDIKVKNGDIKGAVELWKKALECTDCKEPEPIKKKITSAETLGF